MTRKDAVTTKPPAPPAVASPRLPEGVTVTSASETEHRIEIDGQSKENSFRCFGGSLIAQFNSVVLRETLGAMFIQDPKNDLNTMVDAGMAALMAFKPADEIEGMLAAQAVAMHFGAMECFRRSMLRDQQTDTCAKLRKDGVNMARGMTDMLDALDRRRGKGPQVVRVERVVVHEGGQAIVGNVQPGTARLPGGSGE